MKVCSLSFSLDLDIPGLIVKIGKFSSAIAALTLAFSRGCGAEVNTDDILMVALRQLSAGQISPISPQIVIASIAHH